MANKPQTLMDELDSELNLSTEEKLALQILAANPALQARLDKGDELYQFYQGLDGGEGGGGGGETEAEKAAAKEVEKKRVADAAAAATDAAKKKVADAAAAAATKAAASSSTGVSADLAAIENLFETKLLPKLAEKFISLDKLPEYRRSILADAIQLSDQYAAIRESHRAEFGEVLKQEDFEKYVSDQTKAGAKFATLTTAYDQFIQEKRVEKRIADGVAKGIKQKTSAATVPGQTPASGMAPARAQIVKARAAATTSGDGKSSMESAVARLRALNTSREDTVAE